MEKNIEVVLEGIIPGTHMIFGKVIPLGREITLIIDQNEFDWLLITGGAKIISAKNKGTGEYILAETAPEAAAEPRVESAAIDVPVSTNNAIAEVVDPDGSQSVTECTTSTTNNIDTTPAAEPAESAAEVGSTATLPDNTSTETPAETPTETTVETTTEAPVAPVKPKRQYNKKVK